MNKDVFYLLKKSWLFNHFKKIFPIDFLENSIFPISFEHC